jgi:hypothetical protein
MATAEGCEILLRDGNLVTWQIWRCGDTDPTGSVMPAEAGIPLGEAKLGPSFRWGDGARGMG